MKDDVKDEIPNGTPKTLITQDGVLNKDGVSKLGNKPKGDHVAHFLGLDKKINLTDLSLEMFICR
jgi:hypothetical protein